MSRVGSLATLALAVAFAALGCGGSAGSPSDGGGGAAGSSGGGPSTLGATGCTSIHDSCTSNAMTNAKSCEEHGGYDSAASEGRFMSNCQHPNQTYSTAPCDRTGAVGGCALAVNGTCSVAWGYGPIVTAQDIQTSCTGVHGTFITP